MNVQVNVVPLARPRWSPLDRLLRDRLLHTLAGLRGGTLQVHDAFGTTLLGDGTFPALELHVHNAAFYRLAAASGSVGAAEAYIDGAWDCNDLVALVQVLVRNRALLDAMETGPARLGGAALRLWHAARRNTRAGARRNIAAHYDLGNDFFGLFLSDDLMYSSAMFAREDDTLEVASRRKLDRICRKLQLAPGDRVVEIGTGWGGFALFAAANYGCHVTTTTISGEQHALATARVAAAGLQDRVTLLREDYRDLRGDYDKLVSIEMVEAIGAAQLPGYFERIGALLRPGGLALVQAITIEDHRYARALRSVDFIKRHVFPGSFIPSLAALIDAKTQRSDLALLHVEDFGMSYARTLQAWRERFEARLPEVFALGHDARFARLWTFYLAYCEGGFRERSIGVAQLVFAKPGARDAGAVPALDAIEA
ncbi:cyclopropane-fatty-acyl-phospholipid synthase [Lysobacter helvus]|uniref:Cyclopropane-fatty-acyl-phospholipid synthase n=2 Tax=Lysobacteraceae TaxID=32033 RepID=A0ABM7Q375_9GAMM|nr:MULTISPECIES: cyclopropane-fatty-acyl-phospholipid synthase family protein [Lysobacter]BCT91624.1 cyclopropane-fatty-acyl-phospholipid synthase [Lysobacter caseinilyticus]BCT94777.1 cyclopropane-fatty-acyl-phospholipid synthase [Lysobacter helvus]